MTALPKRYFTPEEYLVLEDQTEYKSQDGLECELPLAEIYERVTLPDGRSIS